MLANYGKNRLKVAVLIIAVSLLSFILGENIGAKKCNPFFALSKNEANQEFQDIQKLKPIYDVFNLLKKKYVKDVDTDTLVEGAIKGMTESLGDPHSVYMNPSDFEDFIISVNGSFEGVGLSLGYDEETKTIVVIAPIEGAPAHKAGILPKDRIIKVNDVDLKDRSIDDAVKLMRGKKGTKVTLYIEREGNDEILKFDLVRDDIKFKTVRHEILDDNIGYIKITSFDSETGNEFEKTVDALEKSGVKGIILDLRNNPGGSLQESVRVADRILGKGVVVSTKVKYKNKVEEYHSDERKISLPLVVLINENSASASEIVAGAIQDYKAGTLVGTKTFGKGSVQELEPFSDGSGLKLTIAHYYTPNGRCIDGVGIEPDVRVKLDNDTNPLLLPAEKDLQLKKALEILRSSDK